jgi:DNA-directed RNA polymerase specialized sigma24 family protein
MSAMKPETVQILRKITREQWADYYNELVIYAEAKCRRWRWRTGNKENLPKGSSPEAIASEAVARFYDGEREWNHEIYPGENPVPFLKSVVRSLVSDLGRSKAHETAASLEDESAGTNAEGESFRKEVRASESAPGFRSTRSESPYKATYFKEVNERVDAAIAGREDLAELRSHLRAGKKPAEIAAEMELNVTDVYILIRLFRRRTEGIGKELFDELATVGRRPEGGAL